MGMPALAQLAPLPGMVVSALAQLVPLPGVMMPALARLAPLPGMIAQLPKPLQYNARQKLHASK